MADADVKMAAKRECGRGNRRDEGKVRDLEVSDHVWAQIRGYPSWPGKLVADDDVKMAAKRECGRGNRRDEGKVG